MLKLFFSFTRSAKVKNNFYKLIYIRNGENVWSVIPVILWLKTIENVVVSLPTWDLLVYNGLMKQEGSFTTIPFVRKCFDFLKIKLCW